MIIIIGSTPIIKYYNFALGREPHDIDVVMLKSDLETLKANYPDIITAESTVNPGKFLINIPSISIQMEADVTESESSIYLHQCMMGREDFTMNISGIKMAVPEFEHLVAIKASHVMFPVNADKNLHDWFLLQPHYNPTTTHHILYDMRHTEALERNKKRLARINLNKPNEAFFKPAQNLREFDHDALHRIVAYHEQPLFEKCKHDMSKAKIDRDLFEKLDFIDQVRMVREESMVIGYERYYRPGMSYREVYRKGFTKFVTELCKGWFQRFAIENISDTYEVDFDFVAQIEAMRRNKQIALKEAG